LPDDGFGDRLQQPNLSRPQTAQPRGGNFSRFAGRIGLIFFCQIFWIIIKYLLIGQVSLQGSPGESTAPGASQEASATKKICSPMIPHPVR
jgi:hypothetical protein